MSLRCQSTGHVSHKHVHKLPLLSARPTVNLPATEYHHVLASIELYCLVTEARVCVNIEQPARVTKGMAAS